MAFFRGKATFGERDAEQTVRCSDVKHSSPVPRVMQPVTIQQEAKGQQALWGDGVQLIREYARYGGGAAEFARLEPCMLMVGRGSYEDAFGDAVQAGTDRQSPRSWLHHVIDVELSISKARRRAGQHVSMGSESTRYYDASVIVTTPLAITQWRRVCPS